MGFCNTFNNTRNRNPFCIFLIIVQLKKKKFKTTNQTNKTVPNIKSSSKCYQSIMIESN